MRPAKLGELNHARDRLDRGSLELRPAALYHEEGEEGLKTPMKSARGAISVSARGMMCVSGAGWEAAAAIVPNSIVGGAFTKSFESRHIGRGCMTSGSGRTCVCSRAEVIRVGRISMSSEHNSKHGLTRSVAHSWPDPVISGTTLPR